jgi:hypothetical protein
LRSNRERETADRSKRASRWVAVFLATTAGAFLFFEIIGYVMRTLVGEAKSGIDYRMVLRIAGASALSLLCTGIGVMAITGARLYRALGRTDDSRKREAATDQLWSASMVIVGFAICLVVLMLATRS